MTHAEKIERLVSDLKKRGVEETTIVPPLYRSLWRWGWRVRPPLFQSFLSLFLVYGIIFGIGYGVIITGIDLNMWAQTGQWQGSSATTVLKQSALAGGLFGLLLAGYFRWKASTLGLPEWERYR